MFLASLLALLVQWSGRDAKKVLNMESMSAEEELRALKSCADALLQVETDQLVSGVNDLNAYDLKHISNAIEIMGDLLGTHFSSRRNRLCLGGVNASYIAQFEEGSKPEQAAESEKAVAEEDQTAHGQEPSAEDEAVEPDVEDIVKTEC